MYKKITSDIILRLFSKLRSGNDLSSREATLRVLSAREVFTTVFGMGTGGILTICHQRILLAIRWKLHKI